MDNLEKMLEKEKELLKKLSDKELVKAYKSWMDACARYAVMAFNVGKEVGGEKYVKKLKEEFYKAGQRGAKSWIAASGVKELQPELKPGCRAIGKLMDYIDEGYLNFWDGYKENSEKAYDKDILTCPVAKAWSRAPELCDCIEVSMQGLYDSINPKAKIKFDKLLTKGDEVCHYRIEMKE